MGRTRMRGRWREGGRWAAAIALAVSVGAGCASNGAGPRLARYRPDVDASDRSPWEQKPVAVKPVGQAPGAPAAALGAAPAATNQALRRLRQGDRISISKLGIPQPEEIKDVIDDRGCVNLSYVGTVKIEGLTTSEAERTIEDAYVTGNYYRKITVIVVAQADEYFVQGEVARPGNYPLNVGVTLLRAIATAGGFTDFANPRKISIFRGGKVFHYDGEKIGNLKAEDPVVAPDDRILVARKGWL